MKLLTVLYLTIIVIIPTNCVSVYGFPYGEGGTAGLSAGELIKMLQSAYQEHAQDLQIIYSLIAISIALSGGIVALGVIFLRKRNLKTKPNLET